MVTESKVYYGSARERRLGRHLAYRLIPRHHMPAIRAAYKIRRKSIDHLDAQSVRSVATELQNGTRITTETQS